MRWTPGGSQRSRPVRPVCWRVSRSNGARQRAAPSTCTAASTTWLPAPPLVEHLSPQEHAPWNTFRQDSLAGIVVFPCRPCRCASASPRPAAYRLVGLLTGIIGGLVVTVLSPSRFAVSGPAAGLVTIVVAAIESLVPFSLFLMALVLAGVLQLLFGILRAGRFIRWFPPASSEVCWRRSASC